MTHRLDVARGRDIVARWCALAEQRLEHLTELFETGRWRRYHSEIAFLENIQEAKDAVETWRELLVCEDSRRKPGAVVAGFGIRARLPGDILSGAAHRPAARFPLEPVRPVVSMPAESQLVSWQTVTGNESFAVSNPVSELNPPASNSLASNSPALDLDSSRDPELPERDSSPFNAAALTIDFEAMKNRYPLLRNAL